MLQRHALVLLTVVACDGTAGAGGGGTSDIATGSGGFGGIGGAPSRPGLLHLPRVVGFPHMRQVRARYENGALLPAKPLPLKQGENVSIVVMRQADRSRWDVEKIGRCAEEDTALAEAGLGDWADALDREDRR